MDFDIKPQKTSRQDSMMPQTIEQLIKKYKLDSMWENIQKIVEEVIEQNSGYVVKKDGIMYIADTNVLEEAKTVLRIGKNALDISSNGIEGQYQTIIGLDGIINANFIRAGYLNADRIKGGSLKLGGENNTNGFLQVLDANGKELVTISKDGLILSNGTKLIGNGGVLSNLQFLAKGISEVNGDSKSAGEYWWLGFIPGYVSSADKYSLYIDISVPSNFTITSAYLKLRHIPTKTSMKSGSTVYGYARNVKCYIAETSNNVYVQGEEQSEYKSEFGGITYNEILDCFNSSNNSFTAEVPSSSNLKVTEVVSKNIASKIKKNCRIKIATTNSIPSVAKDCFAQTGFVWAAINIYGYLQ